MQRKATSTKPHTPPQTVSAVVSDVRPEMTRRPTAKKRLDPGFAERHPLRILVAEDNLVNQKVAARLLSRLGYRADLVSNGLEALETVKQRAYDVVLMDIQMPGMDGVEATRRIRQTLLPHPQPRIIAWTANGLPESLAHYRSIGMDDFVSKPTLLEDLIRALEACHPTAE